MDIGLKLSGVGLCAISCAMLLVGCSSSAGLDPNIRELPLPSRWQPDPLDSQVLAVQDHWLDRLAGYVTNRDAIAAGQSSLSLTDLVTQALQSNFQLRQQAYAVQIKKQQVVMTDSAVWPSLDLNLANSRRKTGATGTVAGSHTLSLDLNYELDLWGKLSDNQRQANLNYLAEQAKFDQAKQQLVADVVSGWFVLVEANQLLDLLQHRMANAEQNLAIIEAGYQQGLNKALDVYLARNELNTELSRVTQQQDTQSKLSRQLQRLLGQYPSAALVANGQLPLLTDDIPLGSPADLIRRKPMLLSNWYQLLAKDAALAYAHKQRFPTLDLRASLNKGGTAVADMLSGGLGWSLISSLSAPLFNAGRLEANEQQSLLSLRQVEQSYLDSLYSAFTEVENAVATEAALKQRYQLMIKAQDNAVNAQTLSFEQYQKGLVSYTTVLDAQSRAFDAQSTVIQLKSLLITNRVKLHLALGGDFGQSVSDQKDL